MSFDYSKLSDEDLEALSKDDYSSMTTEGLQHIASYEEPKQASTETPYESNWERAGKEVGTAGVGIGQMALENPRAAAAIASSPISVPVGMKIADKVAGVVNASTMANNANALGVLEHQVRQYAKAGQPVPPQLQAALDNIRGKVAGPVPPTSLTPGAVPGAAMAAEAPMYSKILGGISKLAAPAAIASELFYTSPEDRAALQQSEATGTSLSDWANQKLGTNIFGQNKKKKEDTYSNLTSHEQEVLHNDHRQRADRLQNMIQEAAAKKALVDPSMAR